MTDLAHTKALLNNARLEFAVIARDDIYMADHLLELI